MIIHKNNSQYWIGGCKGWCLFHILLTGWMGIVQCCNIVPSLVSIIGKVWESGLYFAPQPPCGLDHFFGVGPPPLLSVGRGGKPPLPAGQGAHPCSGAQPQQYGSLCFPPDRPTVTCSCNRTLKGQSVNLDPLCVISRQNIEDEKQKNKRKLCFSVKKC